MVKTQSTINYYTAGNYLHQEVKFIEHSLTSVHSEGFSFFYYPAWFEYGLKIGCYHNLKHVCFDDMLIYNSDSRSVSWGALVGGEGTAGGAAVIREIQFEITSICNYICI